jgi:hypothetical protein
MPANTPYEPVVPDGCICRWSPVFRGEWVKDAPNALCPVHFTNCPECHGSGRVTRERITELITQLGEELGDNGR